MAKQILFEYEGTRYTLEFNRNAIRKMERAGFVAEDIQSKPMTVLPELFAGAFIMHHPYLKRERIDKIYEKMTNRMKLIERLSEMYQEPILAMMDEPEEAEGNVNWEEN